MAELTRIQHPDAEGYLITTVDALPAREADGWHAVGTSWPDTEPEPAFDPDAAPSRSARKDAWVAYAVAQGADRDEAEAMTRSDLIDAYGAD